MHTRPTSSLTVGTRASRLARWQTEHVIQKLQGAWPGLECHSIAFTTRGDRIQDRPLHEIGGKGVFSAELESAILSGEIDLAVHSLKDLPIETETGLVLGAILNRTDARDTLVADNGWTLHTLPTGARVGTSSLRRSAQVRAARPDLDIQPIRGNVETRVRKVEQGEYEAAILAAAGLQRLGLVHAVTEWLSLDVMMPAPGQGALAVQCRATHSAALELLAAIDDPHARAATTAERAFLQGLGGGCGASVGAYAKSEIRTLRPQIRITGLIAALDGSQVVRVEDTGSDAYHLGTQLAQKALTQGAGPLLSHHPSKAAIY